MRTASHAPAVRAKPPQEALYPHIATTLPDLTKGAKAELQPSGLQGHTEAMLQHPILLDLPEAIQTQRLLIRSPMPGDGATVNEAILETWDSLHRWLPWARTRPTAEETEERVRQFRSNFIARSDLPVFLFKRDSGVFVGGGGLHRMDWSVPRFEIGYWVRRSCEGQGYVTEAVQALTRFAFGALQAERVEIRCSHRNRRSERVAQRCAFVLDGRLRSHSREPTGELRDTLVYSLVREDAAVQELLKKAVAASVEI